MENPFKKRSLYRIQDVQELFGVSRGTVINRLNDKTFTRIKPKGSRLVYINCDEVNRYFNGEEPLSKNEIITKKENIKPKKRRKKKLVKERKVKPLTKEEKRKIQNDKTKEDIDKSYSKSTETDEEIEKRVSKLKKSKFIKSSPTKAIPKYETSYNCKGNLISKERKRIKPIRKSEAATHYKANKPSIKPSIIAERKNRTGVRNSHMGMKIKHNQDSGLKVKGRI